MKIDPKQAPDVNAFSSLVIGAINDTDSRVDGINGSTIQTPAIAGVVGQDVATQLAYIWGHVLTTNGGTSAGAIVAPNFQGRLNGVAYSVSAAQPTAPTSNDIWFDTANRIVKYWSGTAWTAFGTSAAVVLPDGSVTTAKLADGAVTSSKLADASVGTAKLADASVGTAKLADAAVGTAKLADASVVTAKLADASVGTAKLTDASVGTAKLADASVGTAKLADASVVTAKLADASVGTAKLADASVVTAKLADASVGTAKLTDASVVTAKLADASVGTAKLADASVVTAKLADASVGTAKLTDASVGTAKLADAAVVNAKLADGSVTQSKLDSKLTFPFAALTGNPTTVAGYGITDAVTLAGGQTVAGTLSAANFIGKLNGSRVTVASAAPASPAQNDLWIDTASLSFKYYNGSAWTVIGAAASGGGTSSNVIPNVGALAAASAANRGQTVLLQGASGVPDRVFVSMKLGNDTYDWVAL